ncbi:MAG: PA14 domain-containing protein [Pseudomonadota bacterium]
MSTTCRIPAIVRAVSGALFLIVLSAFVLVIPGKSLAQGTGDLLMTTFPSRNFTGTPITVGSVTVIDQTNLNPGGRGNQFSVRIQGFIFAETTGTYQFQTRSDDGVRLFVNSTNVINNFTDHAATNDVGSIDLVAGTWYPILLEHYENGGQQRLRLRWQPPGGGGFVYPPSSALSRTLVVSSSGPPLGTQDERIAYIVTEEAARSLRDEMAANQRANQDARGRHATAMRCRALREDGAAGVQDPRCDDDAVSRNASPLNFDGSLTANAASTNLIGAFSGQSAVQFGGAQSIYSGDFSVSRFEGGDVSAVFAARYARERMVDDMLLGYFVGLSLTHSDIEDVLDGNRTGYGLSAGAYVVDQLTETLTLDGYLSVGIGRNNLDIRDGGDDISSDYNTQSILMGVALSGERSFERFDLRPELSLSYGYTDIGDIDVTGAASPIVDAGSVTLGRISFEPDFVFALGTGGSRLDTNEVWITPSATCEYQDTTFSETSCGGGLAFEWAASAGNGLTDMSVRLSREVLDGDSRDTIGFQMESRF